MCAGYWGNEVNDELKRETERLLVEADEPREATWLTDELANHLRTLQAEVDRLRERDERLMSKLGAFKGSGDPELDAALQSEDPEFQAFVESMPDNYWARYDLSAVRVGWHFGRGRQVPEGWVAVPRTLTDEMATAMERQWMCGAVADMARREYVAALAAAPSPKGKTND